MVLKRYINFLSAVVALVALLHLSGCAVGYTDPGFARYQAKHEKVAVLPFLVSINPDNKSRDVTAAELREAELAQGISFQRLLYSEFLRRQQQGRYTVGFQDVDETNILLKRLSETDEPFTSLSMFTREELCKALSVDAVISVNMLLSKPMGKGMAIASTLLLGKGGTTNRAQASMSIHEGQDGVLLWNLEETFEGSIFSSPESLVEDLVTEAGRGFPYRR